MIDLSAEQLETVKHILADHVPGTEVRAFGSRVTWTAKDYSDLDLAVVGDVPLDPDVLRRLREAFEESDLPFRVDVLDWHTVAKTFQRLVESESEVVRKGKRRSGTGIHVSAPSDDRPLVQLRDVVEINPRRPLKRGAESVFVAMEALTPNVREPSEFTRRVFKGSGATFQNGDTLLARITPSLENGKTAYLQSLEEAEVGHGSTEFIVLSPVNGATHGLFVYYLVREPRFRSYAISLMEGTSGRQRVPAPGVGRYEFRLPTLPEQGQIASLLGALDDKIALNRRMNETLEGIARAIFKSWFVDFDPVRAKMEGRQPHGMSAETAALFPDTLEESDPGPAPTGWRAGILSDSAINLRRQVDPAEGEEQPYVGLEHVPRQSIALWDWRVSTGLASNKFAFEKGEILFGKLRPYFHKVVVAPISGICSTDILVVGSKSQEWASFNLLILSSDELVAYADATSTGTRMPRTSWKDLAKFRFVFPPDEIVIAFHQRVAPLIEAINVNIRENRTLAELRDTLLPKLISGELRLQEAEA